MCRICSLSRPICSNCTLHSALSVSISNSSASRPPSTAPLPLLLPPDFTHVPLNVTLCTSTTRHNLFNSVRWLLFTLTTHSQHSLAFQVSSSVEFFFGFNSLLVLPVSYNYLILFSITYFIERRWFLPLSTA